MAIQFNPYAAQAQTATANPFAQRGEDQVRNTRDNEQRDPEQVRPQGTSAAETQKNETRNTAARNEDSGRDSRSSGTQRGSNVDITV